MILEKNMETTMLYIITGYFGVLRIQGRVFEAYRLCLRPWALARVAAYIGTQLLKTVFVGPLVVKPTAKSCSRHMGGCQNYGPSPFLDPYYNTAPII